MHIEGNLIGSLHHDSEGTRPKRMSKNMGSARYIHAVAIEGGFICHEPWNGLGELSSLERENASVPTPLDGKLCAMPVGSNGNTHAIDGLGRK